jgi:two-component system invasion response regulator UvrY
MQLSISVAHQAKEPPFIFYVRPVDMITIALIDDHVVLRKSLAVLIEMFSGFDIIIQASNGLDFIEQLKNTRRVPDIVLLDITMPGMDGVETAQWLKNHHPRTRVIVLTMIKNEYIIIRMLKNGARGYLLKDCDPSELREAIEQVYHNGYYYNDILTPRVKNKKNSEEPNAFQVSAQELSFIRWACTEKTYKEIAEEMKISPRTIDGYRDSLFKKLNVTSRIGIVIYAIRNQIVQI